MLKCNMARPMKGGQRDAMMGGSNRAGSFRASLTLASTSRELTADRNTVVWANEEWLKEHALPLAQSGGLLDERPADKEPEEEEVELEQ